MDNGRGLGLGLGKKVCVVWHSGECNCKVHTVIVMVKSADES